MPDIFLSRTEPYPRVDLIIPGSLDRIFFLRVRDSNADSMETLLSSKRDVIIGRKKPTCI